MAYHYPKWWGTAATRRDSLILIAAWTLTTVIGVEFGFPWVLFTLLPCATWMSYRFHTLQENLRRGEQETRRFKAMAMRNADQVSTLSHEIRTPLALVKGAADLLAEQTPGPLNPQQERFVATISRNSDVMNELAEDLLLQARIDAGLLELKTRRVDLRALARSVIQDMREVRGANISFDCAGAPPMVWADPVRIRQAVTNLINNAFSASSADAQVKVRVESREDDALIAVSDSGQGMTARERKRMFDRFVTGRPLRDGTGLGLTITRQIIEMHGGSIHVDTVSRFGTTMLLSLPKEGPISTKEAS